MVARREVQTTALMAYVNAEVEPYVAVNPATAGNLIGVWQQDRWSDGGAGSLSHSLTLGGIFDRVAEQVVQNLHQLRWVSADAKRRTSDLFWIALSVSSARLIALLLRDQAQNDAALPDPRGNLRLTSKLRFLTR